MGRLHRLELENFKSYLGLQIIGPFENFSAIVGPNGSGKSNMMDAISFVLGVQSKHLRSLHLKELIFRQDAESAPARRASVKLVYIVSDDELGPCNLLYAIQVSTLVPLLFNVLEFIHLITFRDQRKSREGRRCIFLERFQRQESVTIA